MKLCQDVVCPVDSFEYNDIYINNQHLTGSYMSFFIHFWARRVSLREFSSMGPQTAGSERPEPGDRKGVQLKKLAAYIEDLLLIHTIDMSQHGFQ